MGRVRTQFVGGESIPACFPLLERLRREKKGALFSYSVEVDSSGSSDSKVNGKAKGGSSHREIVAELLSSIDRAADFEDKMALASGADSDSGVRNVDSGRRTWIAVKMVNSCITLYYHLLSPTQHRTHTVVVVTLSPVWSPTLNPSFTSPPTLLALSLL